MDGVSAQPLVPHDTVPTSEWLTDVEIYEKIFNSPRESDIHCFLDLLDKLDSDDRKSDLLVSGLFQFSYTNRLKPDDFNDKFNAIIDQHAARYKYNPTFLKKRLEIALERVEIRATRVVAERHFEELSATHQQFRQRLKVNFVLGVVALAVSCLAIHLLSNAVKHRYH